MLWYFMNWNCALYHSSIYRFAPMDPLMIRETCVCFTYQEKFDTSAELINAENTREIIESGNPSTPMYVLNLIWVCWLVA